jgi:hypothetical protein
MAILSKGTTFADGSQVTSTNLNDLVDAATFAPGAVDDATIQLSSGKIAVKTIQTGNIGNGAVTNDKIANSTITQSKLAQGYTIETAEDLNGLTEAEFTGIPSWAKRINLILSDVGIDNVGDILIQVKAGSYATSGYSSSLNYKSGGVDNVYTSSSGILVKSLVASLSHDGVISISLLTGNSYFSSGNLYGSGILHSITKMPTLSSTIDSVKIIAPSGTTFDSGKFNISYE